MDKWIVSIGEHSQRSAVTARPPVPRGARQQQRFVWALGDAPGTAPTTAGDSGKRSAVGNVLMGAIGTGRTLPGGSAARREPNLHPRQRRIHPRVAEQFVRKWPSLITTVMP